MHQLAVIRASWPTGKNTLQLAWILASLSEYSPAGPLDTRQLARNSYVIYRYLARFDDPSLCSDTIVIQWRGVAWGSGCCWGRGWLRWAAPSAAPPHCPASSNRDGDSGVSIEELINLAYKSTGKSTEIKLRHPVFANTLGGPCHAAYQ
jgi:hypothetical protein